MATSHRIPSPTYFRGVVTGAAVLALLAVGALALTAGTDRAPAPTFVTLPTAPAVPARPVGPPPPSATPTPSRSATLVTTEVRERVSTPAATHPTRRTRTSPPATTPARATLPAAGTTIGLEPVGAPGHRVRHHDFRARIDPVGPRSSAGDRADTRFAVRAGRSRGDCVSFEAVNHPGYFLRHRDFALRLDRADGSRLFAADSTFCPVRSPNGGFVLRSTNYPDHYLTENATQLYLSRVPATAALSFATRPPL